MFLVQNFSKQFLIYFFTDLHLMDKVLYLIGRSILGLIENFAFLSQTGLDKR